MISDEVKAQMREIAARYPQPRSAMLPCLHLAQQTEGYITSEGAQAVAEAIGARVDEVESVVSFYSMFTAKPLGERVIKVCTSVSCYLRGADALLARLEERLGVKKGQTTADGRFTLDQIECLAACGMAPVLQVNGEFVENVTLERADALLNRLERGEGVGDLSSRWRLTEQGGFTTAGSMESANGGKGEPAKEKS
jgi:NADH-quinone oxidoreductase E subunit